MRYLTIAATLVLTAASLFASKKVTSPTTTGGNDDIDVEATVYLTEQEITQKLGADPGPGIALLEVRVTPRTDKRVQISPDDFILLAHDDGERSKPFDPAEIAGDGALVVTTAQSREKHKGASIGMLGPFGMGGGGSTPNAPTVNSKMDPSKEGNAKLLKLLRAKELPDKESADPVEGFLYFPLEGKHKLKNLAVLYRGPAGKLNLEFQH